MIVYKIVAIDLKGNAWSAMSVVKDFYGKTYDTLKMRKVKYKMGKISVPYKGCRPNLFAFDCISRAAGFLLSEFELTMGCFDINGTSSLINNDWKIEVWEVEAVEDQEWVEAFSMLYFPIGTVLCKSIKPIRRLTRAEIFED